MYLKSIEVHGFKSFANKIVFDFHNGITGIVGPNGSGKSNVADAVRWVLGEQSAKQLRGASMQDIIFAGTENRKPLSYAYVAITLDNSDHKLAVDFAEVTVARRVYRSGESEYLLNGNPCRLKDVNELFYDTGIGKEGYSIIGQGQIEKILNGKPEERRELFDEAAGIVKFKRRKAAAQKKLADERENLVRVNDILSELERQVIPLEKQAKTAKIYLQKKEELKTYDVNMFLLETKRIEEQQKEVAGKYRIADDELKEANESYEGIKSEYEKLEREMEALDEKIDQTKDQLSNTSVMKGKLEGQINVLREQIHTAELTDEHLKSRLDAIEREKEAKQAERATYEERKKELAAGLEETGAKRRQAEEDLKKIRDEIAQCSARMEAGKSEIIALLNNKASIKAGQQRYDTMLEQINIRKAELTKRLLERKSEENDLKNVLGQYEEEYKKTCEVISDLNSSMQEMEQKAAEWKKKQREVNETLDTARLSYHKEQSKLESLKNIAERYEGYGNSIRKVMEQKEHNPGLLGVVSDLIQVDKKYEIAIETALGGNIQNIVTEDEATAKKMIAFLKQNRFGRATFLPLTSVSARKNPKNEAALKEPGVIGIASQLVKCEQKYEEVAAYLLGRVLVADSIDHAIALAKKNHYSLHIVTLEGEYLSPGGSMTGGAFKNSSNLLARRREVEELETKTNRLLQEIAQIKNRREDLLTAIELNEEELEQVKETLQKEFIRQNTAKINVDRAMQQKNESEEVFSSLMKERQQMDQQVEEIRADQTGIKEELEHSRQRETEIQHANEAFQKMLEEQKELENKAESELSEIQLEEANIRQKVEFAQTNVERINGDLEKFETEKTGLLENAKNFKEDVEKKQHDIAEIQKTILASSDSHGELEQKLRESVEQKEQMSAEYRGFFRKQEEISERCNGLDKEVFRLNNQREKLNESAEQQTNYLWEEYELTPHAAAELRNSEYEDPLALKKLIAAVKDEIRKLGTVNVNAIEEYKEVSERYTFLKGQHDDLVEAEQTLLGIIEDLDSGMRKQFLEKFAEIQREFNASFKHLFGGGHGALELVEDEDILECGIRIIAQPPGKKLQNMMQMSGGEKALTAIALLFAIQALKPSPFCLLDEIEAALDDSNVSRFASYLNKLTKNTQFIVITHRRGTMTAADRLYGITMQEKGVSTLVSVDLIEHDLN